MTNFSKLFKLGIEISQPRYLRHKIILTNNAAFFISICVAFPFFILSYFFFENIALIPLLGTVLIFSVLFLNNLGFINLSRVVISILPTLLATIYHGYLAKAGDTWVIGMTLFQVTFSFFPIVIFDLKERISLFGCLVFNFSQILFFDFINATLETQVDDYQFREGFVGTLAIILSCLLVYFMVYILTLNNKKSEIKTSKILMEMEGKTRKLLDSEEELKHSIATLDKNKLEDAKRNWITEGMAEFSNLLRNTQNSETYDQLLSGLVSYIGANQGGLFIVNDGNKESDVSLELVSCYAYDRKKFVSETFEPGEGLLGQAYLEKEPIVLTEIPEDFISITSGLGEAIPNCLLIIPIKFNEEVAGILELASFKVFENHQIEFVEKLGENIASFMVSTRGNEKTNLLLQESQQKAEMLRAQEEEMRQNMEELQATQEEMSRVQKELKDKEMITQKAMQGLKSANKEMKKELLQKTEEITALKEKIELSE